ncbi:MAG: ribosome maturation factor RimP [Deltaproteobacteria bacterium]|nr:ribosome maturation factor RimP [Deltaproteobacteria bacterium]
MSKLTIEEEAARIAIPILESCNMELVDVEYRREHGGWILRLYIDKEGGVTLDDCGMVSREIGTVIEVEELIDHHYNLEVSSPGITRPLKKPADYERFKGRYAKIKLYEAIEGMKSFVALIKGVEDKEIILDKEGKEIKVAFNAIAKANLEFIQEG